MMNYLELINNWHQKAASDTTDEYFSKYVFEYLAFIASLITQRFEWVKLRDDRHAIQLLKQDADLKQKYLEKISQLDELSKAWEKIKLELDQRPLGQVRMGNNAKDIVWWNCSHIEVNQMIAEEREMHTGVLHDMQDWGNMIEFWVGIRNNLFHGMKNPESRRDKFVVEYGYKTIKELIPILLSGT